MSNDVETTEFEARDTSKCASSQAAGSTGSRIENCRRTFRVTGDPKAAIRAYCTGNKWLTENAKAVGNWE